MAEALADILPTDQLGGLRAFGGGLSIALMRHLAGGGLADRI